MKKLTKSSQPSVRIKKSFFLKIKSSVLIQTALLLLPLKHLRKKQFVLNVSLSFAETANNHGILLSHVLMWSKRYFLNGLSKCKQVDVQIAKLGLKK